MRLYFYKNKNKIIIFNHIIDKSIPFEGWIHNCFLCNTLTSREQKYLDSNKYFVIICKDCKHNFYNKSYAVIKNFIIKKNLI